MSSSAGAQSAQIPPATENASPPTSPAATSPAPPASSPPPSSPSSPPPPPPPESTSSSPPPPPPPPSTSSSPPPPPPTTSSTPDTPTTSTTPLPPPPPTTTPSSTPEPSTSETPTTPTPSDSPSPSPTPTSSHIVTVTPSGAVTTVVVITSSTTPSAHSPGISSTSSAAPTASLGGASGKKSSGGLDQKSKVAIGVVVPIAAIAILAILALFFWKKRRARREAEAERRKEVEDYAYNPNADPTIPAVGLVADNSYEMREESSGYRGWGTTVTGSTGRKASTTMSGGVTNAYSDATSPRGNVSEARSGDVLLDGSHSPEGEILGAMGPSAANNRGDMRRGPSNASSSYSAAGHSETSDAGMGVSYSNGNGYYDQYDQNPYAAGAYGQPNEAPPQPIIRDNPARRNTRIENPAHFPQQSAGIAQNF